MKVGLPLMKNLLKPLAQSIMMPLGVTAVASAPDAGIHNKILRSWMTTLIISNKKTEDIIIIITSLEGPCLLIKGACKTVKNEAKEHKSRFLGTLGATLLGNLFGKATGQRQGVIRHGKGTVTAAATATSRRQGEDF